MLLVVLTGCAAKAPLTAYAPRSRGAADLLLGPTQDHTWLAEAYRGRSSWPSVPSGYIFDDVSSYTEVIYDDQSYYDQVLHGGGYTHETITVRTGVLIR
jgi:hypothetical protein